MKQRKRPAPPQNRPLREDTPSGGKSTPDVGDFDFDKSVVARVDESIWAALFDGHFRLAVKCDTCGRWLTSGASKRAHRGPVCRKRAAKAVAE